MEKSECLSYFSSFVYEHKHNFVTRKKSKTCIDHVYANIDNIEISVSTISNKSSDSHEMLYIALNKNIESSLNRANTKSFKKVNYQLVENTINSILSVERYINLSANEMCGQLINDVSSIINENTSTIVTKINNKELK